MEWWNFENNFKQNETKEKYRQTIGSYRILMGPYGIYFSWMLSIVFFSDKIGIVFVQICHKTKFHLKNMEFAVNFHKTVL